MHCPVFSFMILLENIVARQRSNFIQFFHISFKDPPIYFILIVSIPDLCPFYYIVPSNMHCPVFSFMILLENIVVRQRSNFIQFIHISFKDPPIYFI